MSAGRDAIVTSNVWASYTHVHAQATPEWAEGLLGAARGYARRAAMPPVAGPPAGAIG